MKMLMSLTAMTIIAVGGRSEWSRNLVRAMMDDGLPTWKARKGAQVHQETVETAQPSLASA